MQNQTQKTQGSSSTSGSQKMNGNKTLSTANMEMTPEGIQSYITDVVADLQETLSARTADVREYAQEKYDTSVEYVKTNPAKSVLGAVGLGFVLGAAFTALLGRSSSK